VLATGAQDVANQQTALQRQLAGANQLYGMGSGVTGLQNTFGQQQTGISQAQLNANYNQWLMAQQYPFQTLNAYNSTLAAATPTGTTTTQTSAPNNAGYGLLGSALGAGGSALGGYFQSQGSQAIANALAPQNVITPFVAMAAKGGGKIKFQTACIRVSLMVRIWSIVNLPEARIRSSARSRSSSIGRTCSAAA
jgi:hypothetical protein